MRKRKFIWWLSGSALCLLFLSGHIRGCTERADIGAVYVSGRPDLSIGCDDECPAWARSHASDFLDGSGVPIAHVQNLRIAIMQYMMSPAPETIIFRCSLSPQQLRLLLRDKKQVSTTFETVIREADSNGLPVLVFPFKSLSWWPPQKSTRGRLKIYEGTEASYGVHHYIFIDDKANSIWVLASASQGR